MKKQVTLLTCVAICTVMSLLSAGLVFVAQSTDILIKPIHGEEGQHSDPEVEDDEATIVTAEELHLVSRDGGARLEFRVHPTGTLVARRVRECEDEGILYDDLRLFEIIEGDLTPFRGEPGILDDSSEDNDGESDCEERKDPSD